MRYLLNTDSINAIDKIERKLWMVRTTNMKQNCWNWNCLNIKLQTNIF